MKSSAYSYVGTGFVSIYWILDIFETRGGGGGGDTHPMSVF